MLTAKGTDYGKSPQEIIPRRENISWASATVNGNHFTLTGSSGSKEATGRETLRAIMFLYFENGRTERGQILQERLPHQNMEKV
jgi:hypothetical protein